MNMVLKLITLNLVLSISSVFAGTGITAEEARKVSFAGKVVIAYERGLQLYIANDVEEVPAHLQSQMDAKLAPTFMKMKKTRVSKLYGDFEQAHSPITQMKTPLLVMIVENDKKDYEVALIDFSRGSTSFYNISSLEKKLSTLIIRSIDPNKNYSDLLFAISPKY